MADVACLEDHARFAQLYPRCHRSIWGFCARRVPGDVVDDVVADTFLTVWRRLDGITDAPVGGASRQEALLDAASTPEAPNGGSAAWLASPCLGPPATCCPVRARPSDEPGSRTDHSICALPHNAGTMTRP